MSEHTKGTATPGPWCTDGAGIMNENTGELVCNLCFGDGSLYPNNEANAELIVRAVNAHAELVEALKDCIECLKRLPDVEGAYRVTVLQECKDALKKAGTL